MFVTKTPRNLFTLLYSITRLSPVQPGFFSGKITGPPEQDFRKPLFAKCNTGKPNASVSWGEAPELDNFSLVNQFHVLGSQYVSPPNFLPCIFPVVCVGQLLEIAVLTGSTGFRSGTGIPQERARLTQKHICPQSNGTGGTMLDAKRVRALNASVWSRLLSSSFPRP